jgi:putative transposase
MIVGMRTRAQAEKVAEFTGGVQLPAKPKPDGTQSLSRYVNVGPDFEAHRAAVESVSVLFELYSGDAGRLRGHGLAGREVAVRLDGDRGEVRSRMAL